MLSKREIVAEVCIRASVPVVRFEDADLGKEELRAVIRAAQALSEAELEIFDDLLRQIRQGVYRRD